MSKQRMFHIDFIRIFLTSLVIFHHTSIVYGGAGSWYWIEGGSEFSEIVLTLFTAVNQSYFMGMFFLLAGYFAVKSVRTHGKVIFVRDKIIRLGIPLIFFNFVINPIIIYLSQSAYGRIEMSFIDLIKSHYLDLIGSGPLWFTKSLLVFSLLIILIPEKIYRTRENSGSFRYLPLFFFALTTGILAFLLRLIVPVGTEVWELQLGYYVLYIALFLVGAAASVNSSFDIYPGKKALPWIITSIIAFLCFPVMMILSMKAGIQIEQFMGGFNLHAFFYAVRESSGVDERL